jgi:hypothetical protein
MVEDGADLDDYADPLGPLDVSRIMTAAKEAALQPKPTIAEMIEVITDRRYNLEDWQERCVLRGINSEPDKQTMRKAAVLASCANFLMLIETKKAEIARVLRGGA